jgi:hypothetical protein
MRPQLKHQALGGRVRFGYRQLSVCPHRGGDVSKSAEFAEKAPLWRRLIYSTGESV